MQKMSNYFPASSGGVFLGVCEGDASQHESREVSRKEGKLTWLSCAHFNAVFLNSKL